MHPNETVHSMQTRIGTAAKTLGAAMLALAGMGLASAQDASQHDHRDHAPAPAPVPAAPAPSAPDMKGMETGDFQTMDAGAPPAMDHGDMKMQGGRAPADARDPHAYSGGYQRGHEGHGMMMADEHVFSSVLVDRLEGVHGPDGNAVAYEAQAWVGGTYNRLVVKAEGDVARGRVHEARTELLWGHAVASYWDTQLGVRNDAGHGRPPRHWLAFGIQGLAPYWFEVDATAYVGTGGRTALRLSAEYDLLLTQRLILQPRVEANLYGKNDAEVGTGSGLSNGVVGVRLRYEVSRQFAPYLGVERYQTFGNTADMMRSAGERRGETRVVAGVRIWY